MPHFLYRYWDTKWELYGIFFLNRVHLTWASRRLIREAHQSARVQWVQSTTIVLTPQVGGHFSHILWLYLLRDDIDWTWPGGHHMHPKKNLLLFLRYLSVLRFPNARVIQSFLLPRRSCSSAAATRCYTTTIGWQGRNWGGLAGRPLSPQKY